MDLGIAGKVAVIAASSQGLGRAAAEALAREGAHLVINGRDAGKLQAVRDEIAAATGADVRAVAGDMTKPADIDALIRAAADAFGTVHILVNNAGGPPPGYFDQLDDAHWQRAFELTLMSAVRLTRAALPYMRRQKWGRVVNISSTSIKQPIAELLLSNSLRLGVLGWAKSLANEVAADNVLVNTVCPGWTRTERVEQLLPQRAATAGLSLAETASTLTKAIPMGRMGEPREIAAAVAFLSSEAASYITGVALQVDGGAIKTPF